MWGKDKTKKVDFDSHAGKTTMIAQGTIVSGSVQFEGGLLVEGVIKGDVRADPASDALLRLSEAGKVEGEIHVPNIVINGEVNGDVFSSGHVELAEKAIVNGNVHYNLIEMVMGAAVNGALMHAQEKPVAIPAVNPIPIEKKKIRIEDKLPSLDDDSIGSKKSSA